MLLANLALPFWIMVTPFMVWITPVIIGVEAIVIFYLLKDSFLSSLKISSLANITSSLLGIFYISFADDFWWQILVPRSSYEARDVFIETYLDEYRVSAVILLYLISVFIELFFLVKRSSIRPTPGNKTVFYKCLICSFLMNAISYLICVPLFYKALF